MTGNVKVDSVIR